MITEKRQQALAAIQSLDGAETVDVATAMGSTGNGAKSALRWLESHGMAWRVKPTGHTRDRWFGDETMARVWLSRYVPPAMVLRAPKPNRFTATRRGLPAPVSVPHRPYAPVGEAHVPAHIVPAVGVASGHDPRYQCAPGEQPFGAGFAAAGIGRYFGPGGVWPEGKRHG